LKALTRFVPAAAVAALALAGFAAPAASAAVTSPSSSAVASDYYGGPGGVVFVQTDNVAGNEIVAYHRAADGTLTKAGTYRTGGVGGVLSGSVVDHLGSRESLVYDASSGLLFAVNAGSNTVSVFGVDGDQLSLRQVIGSGGTFPVSIATHGDLVYVLNALNGGSVAGFRIIGSGLARIPGSTRALGLDPTATPQFTNTPGQVAFTPDGSQLLVTTKSNGNDVDVYSVQFDGSLSAKPTVNSLPNDMPYSLTFDAAGHVMLIEGGPGALASFNLSRSGHLTPLTSALTGQTATCWIIRDGQYFYASNAGSGTVSGFSENFGGGLTALGNTATDAGTVDAAVSSNGHFLYVQTGGAGIVDEFAVGHGGGLTEIGSVTVPGAVGSEGIAAS
jgi:6-phosphogluconolactonase (cycloisomerase 2 family)